MSFDYDKIKSSEGTGDFWASYSDLFAVMSLIFLLLYVVANLHNGTSNIQKHIEYQQLAQERDDLKQQINVYNTLKEDYLQTGASQEEQQGYEKLMDKIVLLKEEAKDEASKLRQQAQENAEKSEALNEYQQMVRNIINNNMISQARIKRRDRTIVKKNENIKDKAQQIQNLNATVAKKEEEITKNEKEIENVSKKLDVKIMQLQNAYRTNKITKESMNQQIENLKQDSEQQVAQLEAQNQQTKSELKEVSLVLKQSNKALSQAQQQVQSQGEKIAGLMEEKNQFNQQIKSLQSEYDQKMKSERAQFEAQVNAQKLSAKDKAAKLAQFQKEANERQKDLAEQIQGLQAQAQEIQGSLDNTLLAKNAAEAKAQGLEGEKAKLSKDVAALKELADAKKKVIGKIKANLAKSGLEADIDEKTGDVIISFGREYFDSGAATLKPGMEQVIRKFMPAYSESLLSDPATAEKIKSIEIVGFASPTYKGKYVNPVSLQADNKEAVNYNLDLSYYRARAIFDYVFDTSKIKYKHQRDILPMVKVTGRSFLAEGESAREVSSMTNSEYCAKYDCKKSQRVMIKFNMEP